MTTFSLISVLILTFSFGDVLITKGMKQVGEISTLNLRALAAIFIRALRNFYVLAGVACEIVALCAYIAALSWADLSLVLPSTAFSDVVVLLAARYLLDEEVSLKRWVGVVCISLGVAIISFS